MHEIVLKEGVRNYRRGRVKEKDLYWKREGRENKRLS